MSVVAIGSVRSCGVTTLTAALAVTWPTGRRLVVEVDPAGGTLAAQFGLNVEPGLVSLATAARRRADVDTLWDHVQEFQEAVSVLVGPPSREQTERALRMVEPVLAQLGRLDATVLVDCGRLDGPGLPADVFARADIAVLLARPRLPDLNSLAGWLEHRRTGRVPGVVLTGNGAYGSQEVAEVLRVEILGEVPVDADGVAFLCGESSSRGRRSPLFRHVRTIADVLHERLDAAREPAALDLVPESAPRPSSEPPVREASLP